ncbi:hypothetical protein SynBIOSE41_02067 [Synechococcus sp. BIOS-E4-1]|uniref:hypothetical protein n=1 Tax=Synechococcus sp. BIOS-E4-1 TaxID=1400864 RepID=UPI0016448D44|nr:hypothetical protein [Synechococcus sp. BIOS-E4-1]QNI54572.1 hypothetical protein SynBIOSE41_02067 [Synechococcus sp. BIOS-E4-1]
MIEVDQDFAGSIGIGATLLERPNNTLGIRWLPLLSAAKAPRQISLTAVTKSSVTASTSAS